MTPFNIGILSIDSIQKWNTVADPESSEGGPRNLKYKLPHLAAIFYMTTSYRPGADLSKTLVTPILRVFPILKKVLEL